MDLFFQQWMYVHAVVEWNLLVHNVDLWLFVHVRAATAARDMHEQPPLDDDVHKQLPLMACTSARSS